MTLSLPTSYNRFAHALATTATLLALSAGATRAEVVTFTPVPVLTTSITTSTAPTDNADVFFDFLSGTASVTAFSGYQFRLNTFFDSNIGLTSASVAPQDNSSSVAITTAGFSVVAKRYAVGDSVSVADIFDNATSGQALAASDGFGAFGAGQSGFIGFAFTQSFDTFYGYADITVNNDYTVTLNQFGYETAPSAAIAAGAVAVPETGNAVLGLLGFVALLVVRRRRI